MRFVYICVVMFESLYSHHHHGDHHTTTFGQCCRGGVSATPALPPRDGPIVPSNCKTHLTCKPIHPNRSEPWWLWDFLNGAGLVLAGTAVVVGGCVYGKSVIDRNRKKRRDARFVAEGRRPPSDGDSSDDSDEDERGARG